MLNDTAPVLPQLEKVDEVRLFMLYTLFGGNVKRVAVAARVPEETVESLAHDFNWKGKLITRGLETEEGQEDERALNRATNYVTAERLKRVFGRVIDELDSDPAFAKAFCTVVDSKTSEVSYSTKNLTDLAKGLQICHDITYRALQDKQAQAADVTGKATDASTLVLATYRALANRFDHNLSVDATAAIVQATKDARSSTDEEGAG
jgi:hypothetical protein